MRSRIAAVALVIAAAGACGADDSDTGGQSGDDLPEGLTVSGDVGSPPR